MAWAFGAYYTEPDNNSHLIHGVWSHQGTEWSVIQIGVYLKLRDWQRNVWKMKYIYMMDGPMNNLLEFGAY